MISKDKIFSIFNSSENDDDKVFYDDFTSNPIYLTGMYKKIILNSITMEKQLLLAFKNADNNLDMPDVKKAGRYLNYTRAWLYLNKLDFDNEFHCNFLKENNDEDFFKTLKLGLKYFENIEEYEKCAIIKKVIDLMKISY
jgi:hypothetical protein